MSQERFSLLLLVARQEMLLAARSRWTQIFAGVFAILALGVSASGYILSGGRGLQDLARTSSSLVQLVILVVPLASLLMGVLALSPERGTAELLFSQPVSRPTILVGKFLGLFTALTAAEFVGFGLAGVVVFSSTGDQGGGGGYALLILGSLLLTAAFLAIAALLAAGAVGRKRTRALALALVVWFVAVIANPAGAVRTSALLGIQGTAAFGSASLAFLRFTGGPACAAVLLGISILAWVVVPTLAAVRRLARVDL